MLQKHGGTLRDFCQRFPAFLVKMVLQSPDAVVVLSHAELAEYSAVSEALHMPRGSIGPTRGRCLSSLRILLDGEGGAN